MDLPMRITIFWINQYENKFLQSNPIIDKKLDTRINPGNRFKTCVVERRLPLGYQANTNENIILIYAIKTNRCVDLIYFEKYCSRI